MSWLQPTRSLLPRHQTYLQTLDMVSGEVESLWVGTIGFDPISHAIQDRVQEDPQRFIAFEELF